MKFRKILILLFSLSFPTAVIAGLFGGPNDYNSCILESMKGVTSNVAANAIRNSCREKFPVKVIDDEELPQSAVRKIEGNAKQSSPQYFKGTLFNGNNEWTVTSVKIRITDNKTKAFRDYSTSSFIYNSSGISPMSTSDVIFEVFEIPKDPSWDIVNAYGHQSSKN